MRLPDFTLERFYARWEFAVRHNLSASDLEPLPLRELLALADDETRALWERLTLGYGESAGLPLLRAEIAALYATISSDDVLVFTGAEEGIFLAAHALLEPGDHTVVIGPAYQSLHTLPRAIGGDVSVVWLRADAGWALDVDEVVAALKPNTKLLIANFPHSPTGALPDPATFRALHAACAERGVRLFSDEVYRGLELDPAVTLPAGADLDERALSLGVLSKTYGLAGLRVGWIACRDRALLSRIAALKDYTTICGSVPSELLGVIAVRARATLHARGRAIVSKNRALAGDFFSRHPNVEWIEPRAGTTAFPRLLTGDVDRFCDRLAHDAGVLLLPGSMFDAESRAHVRVGLGREGFAAGLEALEGTAL